jgi:hypothetical protein
MCLRINQLNCAFDNGLRIDNATVLKLIFVAVAKRVVRGAKRAGLSRIVSFVNASAVKVNRNDN